MTVSPKRPFTIAAVNEPLDSQQSDLVRHVLDAGFPLNPASLIHLFVGGSQLHGAKVSGYDDLDIYGCYIEPPERILGVLALEHFVWSSGSATETNTADDIDVTTYSLHRWGELIRKGNPAILHYLFAANALSSSDTWERFIGAHRENLISKRAAQQYLGFAASQRMRLTGKDETAAASPRGAVDPEAFIFPNSRGGFMDTGNYRNRVLNLLAERLGLPRLNFQVMRRTMATTRRAWVR